MTENSLKIAIVGMAGRFPGAENLDAFWENLQAGISGGKMLADVDDGLVHYGFALENKDMFDSDFFDVPAREARMLDPQHRIFLECDRLAHIRAHQVRPWAGSPAPGAQGPVLLVFEAEGGLRSYRDRWR